MTQTTRRNRGTQTTRPAAVPAVPAASEDEGASVLVTLANGDASVAVTIPAVSEGNTLPAASVDTLASALRTVATTQGDRALAVATATVASEDEGAAAATRTAVTLAARVIVDAARTPRQGAVRMSDEDASAATLAALILATRGALPAGVALTLSRGEEDVTSALTTLPALADATRVATRAAAAAAAAEYRVRTRQDSATTLADVVASGALTLPATLTTRPGSGTSATAVLSRDASGALTFRVRGSNVTSASAAARALYADGQEHNGWRDLYSDGVALATLRQRVADAASEDASEDEDAS